MAETKRAANASGADELSTDAKLKEFVSRMKDAAASNLESVILYGSGARGDFHPEHSDLNLLCVLKAPVVEELSRVAPVVRWWVNEQQEPAPLFFTAEELRESADVFSIELRDMQDGRRVLHGIDPIAALELPTNLHRVQVEHELRTVLLKLRNAFLGASGNPEELTAVMRKSISSVLALLRHVIIAFDQEPPTGPGEIISQATALTHADAGAFEKVRRLREHGGARSEVWPTYGAYLEALEVVIRALDQRLPKSEWRRVTGSQS
jgi:predicted nucleotidyltransferase